MDISWRAGAWRIGRAALYGAVGAALAYLSNFPQLPAAVAAIGMLNWLEHEIKANFLDSP